MFVIVELRKSNLHKTKYLRKTTLYRIENTEIRFIVTYRQ